MLGAKHYTAAIGEHVTTQLSKLGLTRPFASDLWAVGCIYAELLALRPIFKGEEAKMDAHQAKGALQLGANGIMGVKGMPFQKDQMGKIVEILGTPEGELT